MVSWNEFGKQIMLAFCFSFDDLLQSFTDSSFAAHFMFPLSSIHLGLNNLKNRHFS